MKFGRIELQDELFYKSFVISTNGNLSDIDISDKNFIRFTGNVGSISGFIAPTIIPKNKILIIKNEKLTSDYIRILHLSTSSSNNQINTGVSTDISLGFNELLYFIYDDINNKWNVIGGTNPEFSNKYTLAGSTTTTIDFVLDVGFQFGRKWFISLNNPTLDKTVTFILTVTRSGVSTINHIISDIITDNYLDWSISPILSPPNVNINLTNSNSNSIEYIIRRI